MRINARRGLVRLWIVLSILVAVPTGIASYSPTLEYLRQRNTIGLEIAVPELSPFEIRIDGDFDNLSKAEQSTVVERVFTLVGFRKKLETKCSPLRDQFTARGVALPKAFPIKPWEVYQIRDAFPEYADLGFEDLSKRLKARLSGCLDPSAGSTALSEHLEKIALSAREAEAVASLVPLAIGSGVIVAMWAFLIAAFWIVQGFREKPMS